MNVWCVLIIRNQEIEQNLVYLRWNVSRSEIWKFPSVGFGHYYCGGFSRNLSKFFVWDKFTDLWSLTASISRVFSWTILYRDYEFGAKFKLLLWRFSSSNSSWLLISGFFGVSFSPLLTWSKKNRQITTSVLSENFHAICLILFLRQVSPISRVFWRFFFSLFCGVFFCTKIIVKSQRY